MRGKNEWERGERSLFLRPLLITIKWSPVAVGSIAVCLNLIQADSFVLPGPVCVLSLALSHTHKQANSAQAHLCQSFPLSQEVQVAGPVASLPVTMTNMVSWESAQRDDKEEERRVEEREGRENKVGMRELKEKKEMFSFGALLLRQCIWNRKMCVVLGSKTSSVSCPRENSSSHKRNVRHSEMNR